VCITGPTLILPELSSPKATSPCGCLWWLLLCEHVRCERAVLGVAMTPLGRWGSAGSGVATCMILWRVCPVLRSLAREWPARGPTSWHALQGIGGWVQVKEQQLLQLRPLHAHMPFTCMEYTLSWCECMCGTSACVTRAAAAA
jgi:hypothetical protein